ncbi:clathrin interactor EPSIN, partial [Thalictrum thalictroides]
MDFMKVLDQTVREIKREVNIKVLKVPEIEQKVLDATSNEPWGPHGSALSEIAQATKKFTECQLVMGTLWPRLGDGGRNWRHVYKALSVIEYLVAHGSERALDDIIEHTFQISSLASFEYVEPNGKDMGINVRKKAETITGLLSNKDKIQEVRNKAAANRDKYFGLSSTGISYKSSTASTGFGSSNFQTGDRYGGLDSKKEGEMFKDSYRDSDRVGGDEGHNAKKGSSHNRSRSEDASRAPSKLAQSDNKFGTVPSQCSDAPDGPEDDFDDFDPRGTSKTAAMPVNVNFFDDLMDAPASNLPETSATNGHGAAEVDLFEDADFVSASPNVESSASFTTQADVDLFASRPIPTPASSSAVDLFATSDAAVQSETKSPIAETQSSNHVVDPFASVPLNNFDGSDLFGSFTSHTDPVSAEPIQNSAKEDSLNVINKKSSIETRPSVKKDSFQVKSGIWADSLSRGLIDLNITA